MTLDNILLPIKPLQVKFEEQFSKTLVSEVQLVKDTILHITKNKGKRLRSNLMLLIATFFGEVSERLYSNAIMIELLHTATLLHDDVVDYSMERRNQPSVNAIWDNKVAVLLGDYLSARSFQPVFQIKDYDFIEIVCKNIEIMSQGEILAIQQSSSLEFDEESYFKVTFAKTASLISTACYISANIASNGDEEKYISFKKYGEYVGMAFQIRDDVFDYISTNDKIGKPVGNDIQERKLTLPLIYALQNAEEKTREDILSMIKSNDFSAENIEKIINFAIKAGGIEYAMVKATEFVEKAKDSIAFLPDTKEKEALVNFAEYVITREK